MPGHVLHVGASVICMHGGQVQAVVPNPRVKVLGQATVVQSQPWVVAGCPFVAGLVPMPCVQSQWISGAVRVRSSGVPLLLQDSQAICTPNGTGVSVLATQLRVKAQ